ncbi:gliding motility-associated C-terminal domain-containing protein [Brumimicrobium aurantiacum]|uniref:Gliding motility-associated C-terminal domain-containing protein n=1 Tax=Brumimicrobium aurantiacum TaxID=1737063 RepID=A0A3E1F1Y5_9FLAO|nr:gliding motility-associated C-terminal domain-containing protein [Brumimicrobium aurantiacum]RFC55763.1 gliding motility-associated C-terminal domain-containing protein [Brumimicrobium aurantiacum]
MMRNFVLLLALFGPLFLLAQEDYNECTNAFELCPNTTFTLNNIGANATVCANCEDDFNFCFSGENSIWMTFTTNSTGGDVNVNFNNINFENNPGQGIELQAVIVKADLPCIPSSYTEVSNCEAAATTNFTLNAPGLAPSTTYYVVVNGVAGTTENAEATFDVSMTGLGVERNPQITISTNDSVVCKDENVVFNASTVDCGNPIAFNWFVNGVEVGTTIDPVFETKDLNDGDVVSAEMICFTQCRDTVSSNTISFTVYDFVVDAGPDLYITQGEEVMLEGETSQSTFYWTPIYNINDANLLKPIVFPNETTTYYLTGYNGHCYISDEMTVFVENTLEIPNTFSPNGDGINDDWEILGIENFPDCFIQVYNRWGQVVFQTTGYPIEKRWKGNSESGKPLASGSYYYVVNLRDANYDEPFKGTVTIIR